MILTNTRFYCINRHMVRRYYVIFLLFPLVLCSCMTKDRYLSNFNTFIGKIEKEYRNYSEKDWEKADKTYNRYSKDIYQKFNGELVFQDELIILQYKTKYTIYKSKGKVQDVLSNVLNTANETKERVRFHAERGIEDGIKLLNDGTKSIDETVAKTIDDILGEFGYSRDE